MNCLFVCSVLTWEIFDGLSGFPASVLGAVNAIFFVSGSPRPLCLSRCLEQLGLPWRSSTPCRPLWWSLVTTTPSCWSSALSMLSVSAPYVSAGWSSAPPWKSLDPFAPLWWSSAPPWWVSASSAPPWRASASSALPWWAPSAPLWWAPAPSAPPWRAPGHASIPGGLQPGPGPGPPSLPLFRLRSTTLLDCYASVWKPLLGEVLCHDLAQDLPLISHTRSLLQHMDIALHPELHSPAGTAFANHTISVTPAPHLRT